MSKYHLWYLYITTNHAITYTNYVIHIFIDQKIKN